MKRCELLVIGGGPAGLCAAINAAKAGCRVTVLERNPLMGGQLVKQTHMFFGSRKQHAASRGIHIAELLERELAGLQDNVELLTSTTALGIYEDGVVTAMRGEERYMRIKSDALVVASGACEKSLAFEGNDLPGIYGAGAVQTLMNVYGVSVGDSVVMVGAGNIGLIVSYQLLQAGVRVKRILDAAPRIGGYLVHASKVARMGVPIETSCTVRRAFGGDSLEAVETVRLDGDFRPIAGTERIIDTDVLCISVGLTPLTELLAMAGCDMCYIPQLGGMVPKKDENYMTSVDKLFVAGDVSGIEEASAAMVEGSIAGICAARALGHEPADADAALAELRAQLDSLRAGPAGKHIRDGVSQTAL
ncbi:MAG: NAD(P)/FAD-dependent oxidoreductase [Clostridia bacterium]|nr:NAD(P)/FAD-dependent oxidoreductase [Clostridia bacterium]